MKYESPLELHNDLIEISKTVSKHVHENTPLTQYELSATIATDTTSTTGG